MSLKKANTGYGFPSCPVQKKISISEFEEALAPRSYNVLSHIAPDKGYYLNTGLPEVLIAFPGKPPKLSA
jgi:hypothetical protein